MMIQVEVVWVLTLCSVVEEYHHFRGPCCLTSPWRWRQHGPLKHWYPTVTLYSVTTQRTLTWNITTVKASKLTWSWLFLAHSVCHLS